MGGRERRLHRVAVVALSGAAAFTTPIWALTASPLRAFATDNPPARLALLAAVTGALAIVGTHARSGDERWRITLYEAAAVAWMLLLGPIPGAAVAWTLTLWIDGVRRALRHSGDGALLRLARWGFSALLNAVTTIAIAICWLLLEARVPGPAALATTAGTLGAWAALPAFTLAHQMVGPYVTRGTLSPPGLGPILQALRATAPHLAAAAAIGAVVGTAASTDTSLLVVITGLGIAAAASSVRQQATSRQQQVTRHLVELLRRHGTGPGSDVPQQAADVVGDALAASSASLDPRPPVRRPPGSLTIPIPAPRPRWLTLGPRRGTSTFRAEDEQLARELAPVLGAIVAMADEAAAAHHRAHTDPLTGLLNRAGLEAAVAALPNDGHATVAFVDLDRFKPINDQHGHAIGDEVLQAVAGRLRAAVRTGDPTARVGGDEFVAILLTGSPADAFHAAMTLRQHLVGPVRTSVGGFDVQASVGATTVPLGQLRADLERHLADADSRMYDAKNLGR